MSPFLILLSILALAVLAGVGTLVLSYFSTEKRAVRSSTKNDRQVALNALLRLALAKNALVKIAANDAGNPTLEAQIALESLSELELKELES